MDITLVLGATAVMGGLLALWWALSSARHAHATLDLGCVDPAAYDLRSATLQHGVGSRAIQPLLEHVGRWVRKYTPQGRIAALEQRLLAAGTPRGWTTERVLAAKLLLGGAGLVFGVLQLTGSHSPAMVLVALGSVLFGFFGPDLVLRQKADKRQQLIRRSLADTVDQLVISVRAGLGLDAAIARVARTTEGPLASELARVVQDSRAGVPRATALAALAERVRVPELRQVVVALAQAEKLGVPVAQTLQVQAGELRLKRRQHAEEQAMKLPVKILFPMMIFILPCIFIVVLGPAAIKIAETFGG